MIVHESRNGDFRRPFGAAEVSADIYLAASCLSAASMELVLRRFEGEPEVLPMRREEDGRFSYAFTAPDVPCVLWYSFRTPWERTKEWQLTVYAPSHIPEWWKDGVVYQIFPDSFARGKGWDAREPAPRKGTHRFLVHDWGTPPFYPRDEEKRVSAWPFWGGTLRGIREKLPYLRKLGVTVLYLNPIFEAASNHRYDTADYTRIDPLLGKKKDFVRLCADAKALGIRVVLDGVFNHTGADSVYFDKFGNYGTGDAYRSWYRFGEQYPNGYDSWWNVPDLPSVEETEPSFREFICGKDGVVRRWLRLGASGWRLDVADELPDSFIREIRTAMREEDPESMLMGEVWEDPTCKVSYGELREYFLGSELDSVMHYPFRELILAFLRGEQAAESVCDRFWELKEHYPPEHLLSVMNLLGSHDRERVLTLLGGDKKALRQALFLLFAFPGVPCIYYGDEAGMTGGADPWNRATFPWGAEDEELQAYVRELAALYHAEPLLRSGGYEPLFFGEDVLGCRRFDEGREILALINRSEEDIECFGGVVPAKGTLLLREDRERTEAP